MTSKHLKDVLQYADTAAVIAPQLSLETLADVWQDSDELSCPLNNDTVILSILENGGPAKQMLTLNSVGGWVSTRTFESLTATANLSQANMLALLSNKRLDWDMMDTKQCDNFLLPEACDNGEEPTLDARRNWNDRIMVAAINPSFSRERLADFIRGEKPFDDIPIEARERVAYRALNVRFEAPDHYPGQDMPSSYEMFFDRPTEALFSLIKSGEMDSPDLRKRWVAYAGLIQRPQAFSFGADWLSEEDLEELDPSSGFEERQRRARDNFISWLIDWASEEPLDTGSDEDQQYESYEKGSFAVVAIGCALRHVDDADVMDRLKESGNWVGRAAYFWALIENCALERQNSRRWKASLNEIEALARADKSAFLRAYFCNSNSYDVALRSNGFMELARDAMSAASQSLQEHGNDLEVWVEAPRPQALGSSSAHPDPFEEEQLLTNESLKDDLLAAIEQNEKRVVWVAPVWIAFAMAVYWGSGLSSGFAALFFFVALVAAKITVGQMNIVSLQLKSELRELMRGKVRA
ncbi:hypothetical protein [Aliiroseovarius marinus]|uniref:hypothetical protein n=1 Tax=Aliiroseovarius marinus TaxID=2500159 RepID=UPI00248F9EDC|nr:hypothetical protein [Aliiroseovarius marinus]